MKSVKLLPRMAFTNIKNNGATYFPYIGASIFAVFTFFVFDIIIKSDVMKTVPKAVYAMALVQVGLTLLVVIMIPFLYYANSFLIKRRKSELGLYSILGLEKKHIGIMMFFESVIIYVVVMAFALLIGVLFSKLIYLVLLNMAKIPLTVPLQIRPRACVEALIFYGIVMIINLLVNLFQVGKAKPIELMSGTKKVEKEPKHIWILSVVGLIALGAGYYIAITAQVNSEIFVNFFFAVFLVIVGTYFLFTSGSIAMLKLMRKNKKIYYRPENFITISGMISRMKKNAAGLSNICIFSTMVIVTLVCTAIVSFSLDSVKEYVYPKDIEIYLSKNLAQDRTELKNLIDGLAAEEQVSLDDYIDCAVFATSTQKRIMVATGSRERSNHFEDTNMIRLMDLDEYNRMEQTQETLQKDEILIFSNGESYGYSDIFLKDAQYKVKKELKSCKIAQKEERRQYGNFYLVVVSDREQLERITQSYGYELDSCTMLYFGFSPKGDVDRVEAFEQRLEQEISSKEGLLEYQEYRDDKEEFDSMYGGLLFIGITFGIIFGLCLLLIMYYKQVTEGYEDRKNFEIMQKVGMSEGEIGKTIKKQILLVFLIPLVGAILHTVVAMFMICVLMETLSIYNIGIMISSAVAVCLLFIIFYVFVYRRTAHAYYKIVKTM